MNKFDKIKSYENKILKAYKSYSILSDACHLIKFPSKHEYGTFQKFAQKIKIKKEKLFNDASVLLVDSLGIDMAHAEVKLILDEINNATKPIATNSEVTREKIIEYVLEHFANGYNPKFLFVPIEYSIDVWKWTLEGLSSGKRVRAGYEWILNDQIKLKIKYSNKRTPFDNFIIVDKHFNEWQYKADSKTGERITAGFDIKSNDEYAFLELQNIFKFIIHEPEANMVLKFKMKKKK